MDAVGWERAHVTGQSEGAATGLAIAVEHSERGEDATQLVDWAMPSQIGNEPFTRWLARLERFAASPNDFERQLDSIIELAAGGAPERVQVPAQVMHVAGDGELTSRSAGCSPT